MSSIQARIAALNLNQVNRTPQDPPPTYNQTIAEQPAARRKKGPPPPLPSRPPRPGRNTDVVEHTNGIGYQPSLQQAIGGSSSNNNIHTQHALRPPPTPGSIYSDRSGDITPDLPPRRPSTASNGVLSPLLPPRRQSTVSNDAVSPLLPPRRPSAHMLRKQPSRGLQQRRDSTDSTFSVMSNTSSKSAGARPRIVAPEYDPATLPPLPMRRTKDIVNETPKLPLRPTLSSPTIPQFTQPKSVPPLPSRPPVPGRPNLPPSTASESNGAPPIPLSSRPNLAELQASKPAVMAPRATGCLICRDFSGPDQHAQRFPRESIPSTDVHWIAHQLTAPFEGPTDKARAIFAWLHHNIAYDTVAFFGGNLRGSTPASTIASGLAVCEGYAGLFNALATSAGVESVVVTGHGKGIGYSSPDRNNLPPPDPTGHAWNAFRLDDGQWKLLDACWGAGHIQCGSTDYKKAFAPERFTQSNEDFGIDHFPDKQGHFFRADGRALGWTEYVLLDVDKPRTMGGWSDEGWRSQSLQPRGTSITISGGAASSNQSLRFMFTKVCPHWDPVHNGSGPNFLPFVQINGRGGAKKETKPMQSDGYNFWIDLSHAELGTPGQQVSLIYMDKLDGKEARGLTIEGYDRFMGENRAKSWSWSVLAVWELV